MHVDLFERYLRGSAMTADHHHPVELAPAEARVAAIESVLVEQGIIDTDALDQIVLPVRGQPRPDERRAGRRPGVGRSGLQGEAARRRHGRDQGTRLRGA